MIRPLTEADEPLLWEMLYQGLQTAEGEAAPSPDILQQPQLARYVKGWGRAGDTGFVAHDAQEGKPLGAVWVRFPAGETRKEGDEKVGTPELAFAVKRGHRRHGIGAALLTQFVKAHPQQSLISMSVVSNNPAVRLYERFGFKVVSESAGAVVMRRDI